MALSQPDDFGPTIAGILQPPHGKEGEILVSRMVS